MTITKYSLATGPGGGAWTWADSDNLKASIYLYTFGGLSSYIPDQGYMSWPNISACDQLWVKVTYYEPSDVIYGYPDVPEENPVTGGQWNAVNLADNVSMTQGDYYWIAYIGDTTGVARNLAAGSGTRRYKAETFGFYSFPLAYDGTGFASDNLSDTLAGFGLAGAPVILTNPPSFSVAGMPGRSMEQTMIVSNGGSGSLIWSASKTAGWLNLSSESGTSGLSVTVSENLTGLNPGTYSDNITITAAGAINYLGGRLTAMRRGENLRYIHQDHLTGTSLMTDSNGNQVGTTMKYYPFGGTRSGSVPTDIKFTGQRLDESGLYYFNARYYDPQIGRFISADTIVPGPFNSQAFNRYAYCGNNPLKYTDPSGHELGVEPVCPPELQPEPSVSGGLELPGWAIQIGLAMAGKAFAENMANYGYTVGAFTVPNGSTAYAMFAKGSLNDKGPTMVHVYYNGRDSYIEVYGVRSGTVQAQNLHLFLPKDCPTQDCSQARAVTNNQIYMLMESEASKRTTTWVEEVYHCLDWQSNPNFWNDYANAQSKCEACLGKAQVAATPGHFCIPAEARAQAAAQQFMGNFNWAPPDFSHCLRTNYSK